MTSALSQPAAPPPATPRAGWRARLPVLRVPALSIIAAGFALLVAHFGWAARLETALSDTITFASDHKPSGAVVLVTVDAATISRTGRYPIDRTLLARSLDSLAAAGARRIYIDTLLNTPDSADVDALLEQTLSRIGPERLSLPVARVPAPDGLDILLRPLDRFARHARLSALDFRFDPDRRSRRVAGIQAGKEPMTVDWLLAGTASAPGGDIGIDFSIDPQAVPHVSLLDLAEGRVAPELFKDRFVLIGLTVQNPLSVINVPKYERLNRIEAVALAAETLLAGRPYRSLSMAGKAVLTLAAALAMALVLLRTGSFVGFLLVCAAAGGWIAQIGALQAASGALMPILPVPLACLMVWQMLKLRDSRLAQALYKRYVRLVGVGQSALVMAVDVIADPAFVVCKSGEVAGANERFRGLMREAFPAVRDPLSLGVAGLFPDDCAGILAGLDRDIADHVALSLDCAGTMRHFEASLRTIHTVTGPVAIASLKDVTEVRHREAELTNLAFRDALTGLANRVAFHARLHTMGEDDPARHFAIHLIDLDGFKKVNDTLGHHAGDLLLAGVAARLQKLVRPADLVARLGGDEFAILQAHAAGDTAALLAERIIAALEAPFDIEGAVAKVGASIGIAVWPEHHTAAGEALKLADAAMYLAKRNKPAYAIHGEAGVRRRA